MFALADDELKAGTGFMPQLSEGIRYLEKMGYTENLIPRYDHFDCPSCKVKLMPADFQVDGIMRFENTSDPDDQSILYAISSLDGKIKGAYIESYGLYHEEMSPEMLQRFTHQIHLKELR